MSVRRTIGRIGGFLRGFCLAFRKRREPGFPPHTLRSAVSGDRDSLLMDLQPPARMTAAVSNPMQSRSWAAPTRRECPLKPSVATGSSPERVAAALIKRLTVVVLRPRSSALPW